MKINTAAPVATVRPPAAAPASNEASAPGDSVQLGGSEPPQVGQARALIQEAMGMRAQVGQEFVQNVLGQTPAEFKAILTETDPLVGQMAQQMAQNGMIPDQYFLLASETRKLAQAAVSAEMRAELREHDQQPADRAAFLREELGYQEQAAILLGAFPEKAAEVGQREVQGEDAVSGKTFVNAMLEGIPADQAAQIQQAAAFSPLAQVVAAKPELVATAAASLAQTGAAMVGVTQGCGQYMGYINQAVLPREAQAGALLAQLQGNPQ